MPVKLTTRNRKPESQFRQAAIKYLRLAYGQHFFCLPIVGGPYQPAGSPDVVCSIRGLCVFIEFKAPKESGARHRVGPLQQQMVDAIRAAGGRAGIVSTWEELEELIADIPKVQTCIRSVQ